MDRIIVHVGGSQHGTRIGDYYVPTPVAEGGWSRFIESIQPDLDWLRKGGSKQPRIIIHNPFCYEPGADYEFDQYQESQRARLPTVKDFAKRWQKTAEACEVIGYIGHFQEPDFTRHLKSGRAGTWAQKVLDNVKPLLDAGMSIGLDATSGLAEGAPEYEAIDSIRAQTKVYGRRCYIETRPSRNCPNLHDWPFICTESFWQLMEQQIAADGAAHWAQPKEGLTGECCRWVQIPTDGYGGWWTVVADRFIADIERVQGDGHTVIVPIAYLREALKHDGDQKYEATRFIKG